MNARHVSRELFVLIMPQLKAIKKKLDRKDFYDLMEQAVRTITDEVASLLNISRGELINADQELQESSLLKKHETIRESLGQCLEHTHQALELLAYSNSLPLLVALSLKDEIRDVTIKMIKLYEEHKDNIEKTISSNLESWTLDTIYSMDKNVLILATIELLYYEHIPYKVVADEAVQIAKKFGSEESPNFVNGVLKKIIKALNLDQESNA